MGRRLRGGSGKRHRPRVVLEVYLVVRDHVSLFEEPVLLAARERIAHGDGLARADGRKRRLGDRKRLLPARADRTEVDAARRNLLAVHQHRLRHVVHVETAEELLVEDLHALAVLTRHDGHGLVHVLDLPVGGL